jgi:hypothetical protein
MWLGLGHYHFNHNTNVRSKEQGEAEHRKYKKFNLSVVKRATAQVIQLPLNLG